MTLPNRWRYFFNIFYLFTRPSVHVVVAAAGFRVSAVTCFSCVSLWLIWKLITSPTRERGWCVIYVWSLSTSFRDIWLTGSSIISAVSGKFMLQFSFFILKYISIIRSYNDNPFFLHLSDVCFDFSFFVHFPRCKQSLLINVFFDKLLLFTCSVINFLCVLLQTDLSSSGFCVWKEFCSDLFYFCFPGVNCVTAHSYQSHTNREVMLNPWSAPII